MRRGEGGPLGSPRLSLREAERALLSLAGAATALATLACAAALAGLATDARGSQERSDGVPALAAVAGGPTGAQIREAMIVPLVPFLGGSPESIAELRAEIGELEGVDCRPLVRGSFRCSWIGPRGGEAARLAWVGGAWRLVGAGDE